MKIILLLASSLFLFSMTPLQKKRIVFFGDSITQMGVNKGGYIDRIQQTLKDKGIADQYELLGAGIGGNKVYDLYLRMEDDVMSKKPDVVFIYIGINDVWHKTSGTGTDIDKYEKFYVAIIKKLQAQGAQLVLCTPSVIGERKNNANAQDADLNAYADVVRKLAPSYQCRLVDLRKSFMSFEEANNNADKESGVLTTDKVHLNDAGNQLVATEMMKALGIVQ